MLKDLSKKLDNQNENLKNISKCFEAMSFIIKNTENQEILNILKSSLNDLKPLLTDFGNGITDLETFLSATNTNSETTQNYYNNTLLISEIQNKVVLPYTIVDLQKILATNQSYHNINEIVDEFYTIPIANYKNASLSRFKEAYNLMRKREKSSVAESLSLALEVCFNNALNPAIITACKNLDELDTYLDCLSENELDKFNLFNIKYEILPQKKLI